MSSSTARKVLTVREVAATLSISLPKAYELVRSRGFPSIHIGRRIVVPVAALDEWLIRTSENK